MSTNRGFPSDAYHIGIVCALPFERIAAVGMLDDRHRPLPCQDQFDGNAYTLGEMSGHNVVIACLPAEVHNGTSAAATIAIDIQRTFKHLPCILLVGIGGGVPNIQANHDIRLGDVVVSQPEGTFGGVIQYDLGRNEGLDQAIRTSAHNSPQLLLSNALVQMQAASGVGRRQMDNVKEVHLRHPVSNALVFALPRGLDRLYCSFCDRDIETAGQSCTGLHTKRQPRRPLVHYGTIASGIQPVRNGAVRDRLGQELGAICVETEAAGLMHDFPCLVVRGICDYADSHKNLVWQMQAAIAAAQYTKDLIKYITPGQTIAAAYTYNRIQYMAPGQTAERHSRCYQAFRTCMYEDYKDVNPDRVDGTCQWVLKHDRYLKWIAGEGSPLLLISADPGCGKSVLAKSLIDLDLPKSMNNSICYFFFKDNEEQDNVETALCAILHQLFSQQPWLTRHAIATWDNHGDKMQRKVSELWRILIEASGDSRAQGVTCVIDAPDECRPSGRRWLIEKLAKLHNGWRTSSSKPSNARLQFLITTRPYYDTTHDFQQSLHDLPTINLQGKKENDEIGHEIDRAIRWHVTKLASELMLSPSVRDQIERTLLQMEHRTYLWLSLAVESIYATSRNGLRPEAESIELIPSTVDDAYEEMLISIGTDQRGQDTARKILHLVVGSQRPLTVYEMAIALSFSTITSRLNTLELGQIDPEHVRRNLRHWCAHFAFINHGRIYLIHSTAKDFLLANNQTAGSDTNVQGTDVRTRPQKRWRGSIDPQDSEKLLAEICAKYLLMPEIQAYRNTMKRMTPAARSDVEKKHKFLSYATKYFVFHAQRCGSEHPTWTALLVALANSDYINANTDDFDYGMGTPEPSVQGMIARGYTLKSDSGLGSSILHEADSRTQVTTPSNHRRSAPNLYDPANKTSSHILPSDLDLDAILPVSPSTDDIQSLMELPMCEELETAERYIRNTLFEQETKLEHTACRLLSRRSYRDRLAQAIERRVAIKDDLDLVEDEVFQAPSGRSMHTLAQWLAADEQFGDPYEPGPPLEIDQSREVDEESSYDSPDEEAEDERLIEYRQIKSAKVFIFGGRPFKGFLERLAIHAITPRYFALRRMLFSMPTKNVKILYSINQSLVSRLQCACERFTGAQWDWWPLSVPSRQLKPKTARISWICHCTASHSRDAPLEMAKRFETLLQCRQSKPTGDHLCHGRIPKRQGVDDIVEAVCARLSDIAYQILQISCYSKRAPSSSTDQSAGPAGSYQSSSTRAAGLNSKNVLSRFGGGLERFFAKCIPDTGGHRSGAKVGQTQAMAHRLVLGVRGQRAPLEIAEVDTTRANGEHDSDLVRKILFKHRQKRGWLKSLFSVFRLRYFEYREFEVYPPIRYRPNAASWPESELDYVYGDGNHDPPNVNARPPLPYEERRDALNRSSSPCLRWLLPFHDCIPGLKVHYLYEHIPKKITTWEVCATKKSQAWGIQCFYEPSFAFVTFYVLLILAGPFTFWGWWCSVNSWDIQNASAPAVVAAGMLSLFWAAIGPIPQPRQSSLSTGRSLQDRAESGTGGFVSTT